MCVTTCGLPFASVSMAFRFSSGNTCRSFAPLTAHTGHCTRLKSWLGSYCMILAISGLMACPVSWRGLASADAVREVFPVGVFVYAEMLPNGDHERSAPVAYGVERKGERHGAVQFLVQGAQAVACGGRELRKDGLLALCIIRSFPGMVAPANESTKATSCGRCAAIRKAMVPPMLCPASPVLPRRMSFRRRR